MSLLQRFGVGDVLRLFFKVYGLSNRIYIIFCCLGQKFGKQEYKRKSKRWVNINKFLLVEIDLQVVVEQISMIYSYMENKEREREREKGIGVCG